MKSRLLELRHLPRGQLQGGSFRVLSLAADRPPTYGKFVMDKWIKEGNTQKIFICKFPSFLMSYFSKTLNPDKEELILDKDELVLDKEREILSLILRDFLS